MKMMILRHTCVLRKCISTTSSGFRMLLDVFSGYSLLTFNLQTRVKVYMLIVLLRYCSSSSIFLSYNSTSSPMS